MIIPSIDLEDKTSLDILLLFKGDNFLGIGLDIPPSFILLFIKQRASNYSFLK